MNATKQAQTSDERVLVLTRIFDAPAELVYKMWTDPKHIREWLCPRGFTLPHSEGEQRVGGRWRSCMRTPDGVDLWLSGIYKELVPGKKITFTHAWEEGGKRGHETVVTITLEDIQGKTRLMLRQELFESVESRDGHAGGWNECLDKLVERLA